MKFEKFVKSLGSDGTIYVRGNGERWLSSGSALMKIKDDIKSIVADEIADMPAYIDEFINYDWDTSNCELTKAIMPFPKAAIKDCIRIFAVKNTSDKVAISNNNYALIENRDIIEMYIKTDYDKATSEGKALIIKEENNETEDLDTIGVILPIRYEEEQNGIR